MAAKYGWIIDKDHLADDAAAPGTNDNAVGLMGPCNISETIKAELLAGKGKPFRMLGDDDESELAYEGRIIDERGADYVVPLHESPCFGFEPLDDFGRPNAGCTTIQYADGPDGAWEDL